MKTVYVLGAGFSFEAGAPVQNKLIEEAMKVFSGSGTTDFQTEKFEKFRSFLTKQLNIPENELHKVQLEDIFTPLDRCLSENSQFRGVSLEEIMKVREAVFYVVGKTIQTVLNKTNKSKDYIDAFARFLTEQSSIRAQKQYRKKDPVSVISTNWDILLDNAIYGAIDQGDKDAVVDYCCYISSEDENDHTIKPGLEKLGQGGFNVKLLKLHGSLNWLQCPRCMRLYAKFYIKQAMNAFERTISCRHCDKNFPEERDNHKLISNLIMPTFLKDLTNPQYKIIWQNAGIEISEADKLVFIGYSLPTADFDFRQLLSRMTRKKAKIEVVDYSESDDYKNATQEHWKKFFGDRELSFHFGGAKDYIENL